MIWCKATRCYYLAAPKSTIVSQRRLVLPFIAVTILFFLWGFITVLVDALVPRLKEVFDLSYAKAGVIQFAWFIAYFLFSIPGGWIISKLGYKKGIIFGLGLIGIGALLFYPAAGLRVYGLFLMALFVVASGITMLQVAANPYIAVLGPKEGASSRLNLAQAFNSLGTTIAPILAVVFLLSDQILSGEEIEALDEKTKAAYFLAEAGTVQTLFLSLAVFVFLLAGVFALVKLPKIIESKEGGSAFSGYAASLKHPILRWGIAGIFVYVGAEVAIGSFLTSYFVNLGLVETIKEVGPLRQIVTFISETFTGKSFNELDQKGIVGSFVFFYWFSAMIGRFIGAYLTKVFKPSKVLSVFGFGAILLILISISSTGLLAMFSILAVGLFNSIMFPTIFTLSIAPLGEHKAEGSGLLCTAIVGGAVIPGMTGLLIDFKGFPLAFGALSVFYFVIVLFGRKAMKSAT